MNYDLSKDIQEEAEKQNSKRSRKTDIQSLKTLVAHMVDEKRILILATIAMVVTAILNLLGPYIIGYTIDNYIQYKQFDGVLKYGSILLGMYIVALAAGYLQTKLMGTVGQNMLYALRNSVFCKLQELPLDFFNQNRAGDLISRINNDTEKINQFFSQSLMQFVRSILIMIGAGIFLLSINLELGSAALVPAIVIWLFTRSTSYWVKSRNKTSLKHEGKLSSEVQENLANFKVVVAFDRRDYFRERFNIANKENYSAAVKAGISNTLYMPVYTFFSNIGQMIVLVFGIYLIANGSFTVGLLVSFLTYITNFYNPLRQLATLWANFQRAMAAWDRVLRILNLRSNMPVIDHEKEAESASLISFKDVSFTYPNGKEVLHQINFDLERGKTYAFVGPTGGGKTTTASLVARLYDPTLGNIYLDGRDIRSYKPEERVRKIGFILQDPFLFSGTVRENILYGNENFRKLKNKDLQQVLKDAGLESLLQRFDDGLDTKVGLTNDEISLGQKQIIAFIRAVLRQPDLLILDEATANIDTVTEQQLEDILQKLPSTTTKVIIAHRLNTIENADEIYFVNTGEVIRAGSLGDAVTLLMQGKMGN